MRHAFSLIQLLIVITIIAVLASMAIAGAGIVRKQAEATRCLSNLRQMQVANLLYANDYRGRFVPVGYVIDAWGNYYGGSDWPANQLFLELCNASRVQVDGTGTDYSDFFLRGLVCPVTRRMSTLPYYNLLRQSYACNTQEPTYPRVPGTLVGPTTRLPRVSERFTFIDAIGWQLTNYWYMNAYTSEERVPNQAAGVALRHRLRANLAFGDGSVRSLPWGEQLKMWNSGLWNP